MVNIIKRNGQAVPFDKEKIITAINRAFLEVDGELYEDETAENGKWNKGPGIEFFKAVEKAIGKSKYGSNFFLIAKNKNKQPTRIITTCCQENAKRF